MANKHTEDELHVSRFIILYKLTLGLIELLTGVGVAVFGGRILAIYGRLVAKELSEDPHDILVHFSEGIVPHLFTHDTYLVFSLILLGLAKISGAVGLVYKQNWGVDLLVGLTVVMFPFQLVGLIVHPAVFDLVYITTGLLIALYLIEFKPRAWISKWLFRLGRLAQV